jgi:hypothetical protein
MVGLVAMMLVLAGCGGGNNDSQRASSDTTRTNVNKTYHIDFSDLTTYTSNSSSYSIQYPETWRVSDAFLPNLSVRSPAFHAGLDIVVIENVSQSYTLNQATAEYLRRYRQSNAKLNRSVEILNRETVALPSGQSARRIDLRANGTSLNLRRSVVITLVDNTIYIATIVMPEYAYTPTVAHQMDEILGSFTVRSGPSSNQRSTETHYFPRDLALALAPAPYGHP